MQRIGKAPYVGMLVASMLLIGALVFGATAASAAGGGPAVAAKKAKLKILAKSQKKILRKGAIKVSIKRLDSGKLRLKGRSKTFDKPEFKKLTKPAVIHAGDSTAKLKLNAKGKKKIRSCESRKIQISAKGAGKKQANLKRDTKLCRPKPIDLTRAADCDFIADQANSQCLMPFPDDYYTVKDASTATGRRVNLGDASMPQNAQGAPISAAPYNLNDGFSPGQTMVMHVPGLDTPEALAATNPAGLADLGAYADKRAPVVVIDEKTGERQPIWVELDSRGEAPENTALLIHPARNLESGHRYVVAMRKLKNADGSKLAAPEGFRYYRDKLPSSKKPIKAQSKRFENVFRSLRKAKIKRANLYLAWDFTVASDENIAARMLFMRTDAFAQLGDTTLSDLTVQGSSPQFTVDSTTEFAPCGNDGCQDGEDDLIQREVTGTFEVPCYLQPDCGPGGRFELDAGGLPSQNGTWTANFNCIVPRASFDTNGAAAGARPSLYGHGLLGSAGEVSSDPQRQLAQKHGFVTCATDQIGFAEGDVPNTIGILKNLGDFPELTDRVQQGLLDELYLGRLMIHPDGFDSVGAFHVDGATTGSPSTIDTSRLYYNSNSEGGILGGALTAIAPDFTRASLGVPAMNYSVLLPRSVDFDLYETILEPAYPNPMTRTLALSLIQMLWDRSEANGYAHRMTDQPLADTPAHEVLMNVAFGDHQVTTWQADVEARTVGAQAHDPVVYDGRWPGVDVLWDIPRITSYPYQGSAIVYWDSGPPRPDPDNAGETIGTDPPPIGNEPNRSGADPHGKPRLVPGEQQMVSDFLRPDDQSAITDTCNGQPCFSAGFTGP